MNLMTGALGTSSTGSSEGIQMEYFAIFLAVLFPGALVAFNHESLQALPRLAVLRVYCAGIWHNAAFCALCAVALFLLPLILYPFYIYGEGPMVLDVSSTSPLAGYLSPGDLIVSVDGTRVHNTEQWMEMSALLHEQTLNNSNYVSHSNGFMAINHGKGYCVRSSLIEGSRNIQLIDNQTSCPSELTAFVPISCFDSSAMKDGSSSQQKSYSIYCLTAKDIIKLKKCGNGWVETAKNKSSCQCSEDESCIVPVPIPGLTWVEITYSSPYSPECWQLGRNSSSTVKGSGFGELSCGGTFVFIGDIITMAKSVLLTAYQPRWSSAFALNLPNILEKFFMCTFNVSLMLALVNSLPVYFLDGESILEMTLSYFTLLSRRKRRIILRASLLAGTLISIVVFFRIFVLVIL